MKLMIFIFIFSCLLLTTLTNYSFGQAPAPTPTAAPAQAQSTPAPTVQVAEPAAPPKWAEQLIMNAQKLPVVGPIVTKALVWAGIVSSILTALVAFLLTSLSAITGILNIAGLAQFAEKVQLFKNGKIMYWLSYLSMFNAKKPDSADQLIDKKAAA